MTVGKEGKTDVGNGGVATPVATSSTWRIAVNQTLVYGSTNTEASTMSQLNTLATCGPYFSPCLSRCICGLQDTGL